MADSTAVNSQITDMASEPGGTRKKASGRRKAKSKKKTAKGGKKK